MMNYIVLWLKKHRYAVMSAVLAVLIVILIAVIFVFNKKNNDISKPSEESNINIENMTVSYNSLLSGDSRFLVVCNGDNPGDIVFMTLIDFKIYSESIIVTPLSVDTQTSNGTYSDHYAYGGIANLKNAIENERQCDIDRYVIMDKDGFCDIIDLMGKINVFVEEEFTYVSSDKSYNVPIGENELEAPMLFSYVKLTAEKNNDLKELAELFCLIINTYLTSVDEEDAQKYFEDLSNCVNTDVSISDYYSCSVDINHLLNNNAVCIPFYEGDQ